MRIVNVDGALECITTGVPVYSVVRLTADTPIGVLLDACELMAGELEDAIKEPEPVQKKILYSKPEILEVEKEKAVCFAEPIKLTVPEPAPDPYEGIEEVLHDAVDQDGIVTYQEEKTFLKPSTSKPSKEIDHGKLIALWEAGWSIADIKVEFGCSDQTVRNHIAKEMRDRKEKK